MCSAFWICCVFARDSVGYSFRVFDFLCFSVLLKRFLYLDRIACFGLAVGMCVTFVFACVVRAAVCAGQRLVVARRIGFTVCNGFCKSFQQ